MTAADIAEGARLLAEAGNPREWHPELSEWLNAHAAELIADAGRYQWLRRQLGHRRKWEVRAWYTHVDPRDGGQWLYCDAPILDQRIDAARASGTEGACS